nr:ribonuclease H-like domain-containing protein [Tanacetum cinerariifolium]
MAWQTDYCIMKEGMPILRGWKSVPGMNSIKREMERGCFGNDENADEGKKEDDMGACIEKLDKIGWAAQDPMFYNSSPLKRIIHPRIRNMIQLNRTYQIMEGNEDKKSG